MKVAWGEGAGSGISHSVILQNWDEVRDQLVRSEALPGTDLVRTLQ
jgi:hypothetical protein